MGLYYNPPPPFMGAAQPLEGKKLDPPQSGPPPQNPPFMGGSAVHKAILGCWAAAVIVSTIMPVVARNLTPPSAPVVSTPLFKKTNFEIYRAWDPPVLAPIVARNLTPPSGPAFVPPISSVVFDSKSTGQITGLGVSTFTDSTLLTVGNNPNRALVVQISLSTAPVTFSCSWDGQAMTQLALILDTGINNTTVLFGLLNPNPGTKTLTGSWSNSSDFIVEATSLYNVDQTSLAKAFPNIATAQGTVSPNSVAVASAPGNMVIAAHTAGDFATTFTATNNTTLFTNSVTHICAAGNIAAGAATITSTATQAVDKPWTSAAVDVQAVRTLPSRWPQEATIAAWNLPSPAPIVGPKLPPQPAAVAAFPFRGSSVSTEVLVAWTAAPFFPIVEVMLDPPIAGPTPQDPPFMGGARVAQAILNAWIPPPPAPIVEVMLDPPIAGPAPTNPPFAGGAAVSQAVLNAWIPPPPAPIVAINLTPPTPPVVIFTPPARLQTEVLSAWQVVAPAAITARNLTPSTPSVATFTPIGSRVSTEVLVNWALLPPAPIVAAKLTPLPAVTLWTPANLTSVTLEGWYRVHDPAAILADGSDLTLISTVVQTWADRSGHGRTISKEGSPGYDANGLSTGHPAATFSSAGFRTAAGAGYPTSAVIGSVVLGSVSSDGRVTSLYDGTVSGHDFDNHGVIPLQTVSGINAQYWFDGFVTNKAYTYGTVALLEGVPLSTTTADVGVNTVQAGTPISVSGITHDRMGLFAQADTGGSNPAGVVAENVLWAGVISLSDLQKLEGYITWNNGQQALLPGGHPYAGGPPLLGPTDNPPFAGSKVPQAILNAWLPPAPAPIVARNLTPPSGPAATNPPFTGALVPVTSLEDWSATIILARNLTPPSGVAFVLPVGTQVPQAVLNAWQAPAFAPILARNLTPPSGPPVPINPVGTWVHQEILNAWLPAAPMPIVAVNLNPPQSGPTPQNPPIIGSQVPEAELVAWIPPPPMPIVARNLNPPIGVAAPTNPPFAGTSVPIAVLDAWIPPAPMPVLAINLNPPISGPLATNPPFTGALVPIVLPDEGFGIIVARNLTPPSAPSNLPLGGGARVPGEVLINWLPAAPVPFLARYAAPASGPAATNPPFAGGARLPLEIQLSWQAAQPGYPPLKTILGIPTAPPPPPPTTTEYSSMFFTQMGQMMMIQGTISGAAATKSFVFSGADATSVGANQFTSTTIDIGPATADRYVILAMSDQNATGISSVTVNGVSLAPDTQNLVSRGAYIWSGLVGVAGGAGPATIVMNFGATAFAGFSDRIVIAWTGRGLTKTNGAAAVATGAGSINLAVTAGDFLISCVPAVETFNGSTETPTATRSKAGAGPVYTQTSAEWNTVVATNAAFAVTSLGGTTNYCAATYH